MKKEYKIAMVGLGSIGKRHLLNLDLVLRTREIKYSIDLIRRVSSTELEEAVERIISKVYFEDEEIPSDYDIVFITNPTYLHYETINIFKTKARHMFIEKPVFDKLDYNLSNLELSRVGECYVACPLRHTEVIRYVKDTINKDEIFSARAICSSYLPEWRPGVDYRETYSAHLEQGGGVSIDLIHEWDYLVYLFGKPKKISNFRGTFSNLEIDSDDLSVYIAEYENKLVEVHLDYFGRKTVRELHLLTKEDTIIADITNSEIRFLKANKVIQFHEERNAYQIREIEHFFNIIEGSEKNENDIITALTTLKIAKEGHL